MWVVGDDVRDSQASLDGRPVQHLASLVSVEDDATGEELNVVWEIEPGTMVVERAALPARVRFFVSAVAGEKNWLAHNVRCCD